MVGSVVNVGVLGWGAVDVEPDWGAVAPKAVKALRARILRRVSAAGCENMVLLGILVFLSAWRLT